MRKSHSLLGLGLALLAAGCSEETTPSPATCADRGCAIAVRVEGDPSPLSGVVTAVVEASPEGFFHGVEIDLGGARVGTVLSPPFVLSIDTTTFPDGPAELSAVGVVAESGEEVRAAIAVDLANVAPALTVIEPRDGEEILGSPTKGFAIHPIVEVDDPNGVASLTVTVEGEEIDLGAGDGSIAVPIPAGADFPRAPLDLVFTATDLFGNASTRAVAVTPTNLALRFERSFGYALPMLARLDVAESGALLCQIGKNSSTGDGPLYGITDPGAPAEASLSFETPMPGPAVQSGEGVFFFTREGSDGALYRATHDGASTLLLTLPPSTYSTLDPLRLADGRVLGAWVDPASSVTHAFAYHPDGALDFTAALPLQLAGQGPPRVLADRLLLVASAGSAPAAIHPMNTASGALDAAWALPSGNAVWKILAVDPAGVVTTNLASSPSGPPSTTLSLFAAPGGASLWEHDTGGTYPYWARVEPGGEALVFSFASQQGARSELSRFSDKGKALLWQGGVEAHESLLGAIDESTIALVGMKPDTQSWDLIALGLDGAEAWRRSLARSNLDRFALLADGSVLVSSVTDWSTATDVALELVDAAGVPLWQEVLPCRGAGALHDLGDLVVVQYVHADGSATVFEARDRATGALRWRYREPSPANLGGTLTVMAESAAWGVILGPAPRAVDMGGGVMTNTAVVLGLVP